MKKNIILLHELPPQAFNQYTDRYNFIFPDNEKWEANALKEEIKNCDGIISVFGTPLTHDLIDAASKLKIIANFGVGYDNIDVPYVTQRGIVVTNTPNPVTEPTAELAYGLMLAVARNIGTLNYRLKNKEEFATGVMKNLSTTLTGKTLGIIGLGAIGKAMARRALAANMKIIYFSRNRLDDEVEKTYQATYVDLKTLFKQSDVVSLHIPLTANTKHLIGKEELNQMKITAFLINTARGAVIDQETLHKALKNNVIAGAGLDVFEDEPNWPLDLIALPNVVATPHVGTATMDTRIEMTYEVVKNLHQFFTGHTPQNIVNPEVII